MTPAWTGSSTTVGGEEAITINSIVCVSAWGSECSLGGRAKYQHRFTITILKNVYDFNHVDQ